MKDSTFLLLFVMIILLFYIGNKHVISRSKEVLLSDSLVVYKNNNDSLKTAYIDLKKYAMDLEGICNNFESSKNAKKEYHLKTKKIIE